MYYNGISNLKELINAYHVKLKRVLPTDAPNEIILM